ncbi:response regulator [Thalassotalea sp. G2M2-11]|uniref:response regulator n=1 Tax=Thalassotalea sp. G2M2-11 TaxID=2787627 RepID=UPI0019D222F7|nr:response regulator [Thalassotalea sp. G2M2-11]
MPNDIESSILIVDDSKINVRIISKMIEELGHQIYVASNGIEALKLLTKFKPTIILMDIKMPKMDGFSCCQRIKRSASRADIPIIFMSGSHDKSDIDKAKAIGGKDYLTKPINIELLKQAIDFNMPWS